MVFGNAAVRSAIFLSFRLQRCDLPHSKRMAASTPKPETPGWRHLARPVWAEGDACAAPGLSACDAQFRIRTIALTCPSELRARFYGSTRWRPRFGSSSPDVPRPGERGRTQLYRRLGDIRPLLFGRLRGFLTVMCAREEAPYRPIAEADTALSQLASAAGRWSTARLPDYGRDTYAGPSADPSCRTGRRSRPAASARARAAPCPAIAGGGFPA